jgi:hypothetical protein
MVRGLPMHLCTRLHAMCHVSGCMQCVSNVSGCMQCVRLHAHACVALHEHGSRAMPSAIHVDRDCPCQAGIHEKGPDVAPLSCADTLSCGFTRGRMNTCKYAHLGVWRYLQAT